MPARESYFWTWLRAPVADTPLQVNIDDGFLNLMTQDGAAKDDVKLPESDLGKQIQAEFEEGKDLLVTIVSAMGEEQAISYKEAPKGS